MASFSTTELNATIDEQWAMELEEARYAAAVIVPRIMNKSAEVRKSGDRVHVTVKDTYSTGDVGANGAFTPATITPSTSTIIINQHKYVSIETEDRAVANSFWDPVSDFPSDAGKTMGETVDGAIAGLHTDLTTNVVGDPADPTAFDTTMMRAAMLKLADLNVPRNELSFILPPIAFYNGVFTETQLTGADTGGFPKNILTTNFRFPLLGVPAFESTLLKTVATAIKGFLVHRSCLGIAMQKNSEFKRAERTSALVLSFVVVAQSLYGVKTIREDHGVVLNIRNS